MGDRNWDGGWEWGRMQPCKLQCCHMKGINETKTSYVFFVFKGHFHKFYLNNASQIKLNIKVCRH